MINDSMRRRSENASRQNEYDHIFGNYLAQGAFVGERLFNNWMLLFSFPAL